MMDLDEAAERLLESDEYYQSQATELITFKQLKERHKEQIKEAIANHELSDSILRGFKWIKEDIVEVLTEEELVPFFNELSKISQEQLNHPSDIVQKKIENHEFVSFQELFGLSNQTLQKIYTLGYQYFKKNIYDRAIDIFSIVTTFNPFVADFWNALALCYQATQRWKEAIEAFTLACSTKEGNVASLVSKAECCLKLNMTDEAIEQMEFASQIIKTNPALDEEWGAYLKDLKKSV